MQLDDVSATSLAGCLVEVPIRLLLHLLGPFGLLQEDALEERCLTQHNKKPSLDDLFGLKSSKPRFVAAQSVWKTLVNHGQISVTTDGSFAFKAHGDPQQDRVHHWVFVVSYNRFNTKRKDQVLLDWSDAAIDTTAQHAAGYVRVLVIRPEELQIKVLLLVAICTLHAASVPHGGWGGASGPHMPCLSQYGGSLSKLHVGLASVCVNCM